MVPIPAARLPIAKTKPRILSIPRVKALSSSAPKNTVLTPPLRAKIPQLACPLFRTKLRVSFYAYIQPVVYWPRFGRHEAANVRTVSSRFPFTRVSRSGMSRAIDKTMAGHASTPA